MHLCAVFTSDSSEDDSASEQPTTTAWIPDSEYLSRNLSLKNHEVDSKTCSSSINTIDSLELGYLNNQGDNKVISSEEYQQNIASIANALKEYFHKTQ